MRELVDLVDARGEVVERAVPRDRPIPSGLLLPVAIAIIRNDEGNFLVHERGEEKTHEGEIDHVCGALRTDETPEEAAVREARKEVEVGISDIVVVHKGPNEYGRYRFLIAATSNDPIPEGFSNSEAAWAAYLPYDELTRRRDLQKVPFVDGFFEDMRLCESVMNIDRLLQ